MRTTTTKKHIRSQIRELYRVFVKSREPTTAAIDGRSDDVVE
jgi:hypothetical protein